MTMDFYGRKEELDKLWSLWKKAVGADKPSVGAGESEGPGPQLAVIIAESGVGKTRLAWALYEKLASDDAWNPEEIRYWPKSPGDKPNSLRGNPHVVKEDIKGLPHFFWLGVKWSGNARVDGLPIMRNKFIAHVKAARSQASRMEHYIKNLLDKRRKIVGATGDEIATEALTRVAELLGFAVPGMGLFFSVAKAAFATAKELDDNHLGPDGQEEKLHEKAGNELLETLKTVLGDSKKVPVLLLLDDAQWMDAQTAKFMEMLWEEAEKKYWPLMIVATHWEREWNENRDRADEKAQDAGGKSTEKGTDFSESPSAGEIFSRLARGKSPVEIRLGNAKDDDLEEYIYAMLPGVHANEDQRKLLLRKAGGNFLSMVENVIALKEEPEYFVGDDVAGELKKKAQEEVDGWDDKREVRIEKRFKGLKKEQKALLGLGSHSGFQFPRQVVEDFAVAKEVIPKLDTARQMLSECIDPLAVLEMPGDTIAEFRDQVWFNVAKKRAEIVHDEHLPALADALRKNLAEWVDGSFDARGNLLRPGSRDVGDPAGCVLLLDVEERRALLDMAAAAFPWEGRVEDALSEEQQCALRLQLLLNSSDAMDGEWGRVKARAKEISAKIDWKQVPDEVVSLSTRNFAAGEWMMAGAYDAAETLLLSLACRFGFQGPDYADLKKSGLKPWQVRQSFSVVLKRAKIKRHQDKADEALGLYRTAEKMCSVYSLGDKSKFQALMGQRRCLQLLGKEDDAENLDFDSIDFSGLPDHYFAAVVATEEELLAELTKAKQSEKSNSIAINSMFLAKIYRNRREYRDAVKYYSQAYENAGGDHKRRTLNAMIESVAQTGSEQRFKKWCDELLGGMGEGVQDQAVGYLNIGRARALTGQLESACGDLERATQSELERLNPTHLRKTIRSLGMLATAAHIAGVENRQDIVERCRSAMKHASEGIKFQESAGAAKKARKLFNGPLNKAEKTVAENRDWSAIFELARNGRQNRDLPDVLISAARATDANNYGLRFGCWLGAAYLACLDGFEVFSRFCLDSAKKVCKEVDLTPEVEPGVSIGNFLKAFEIEVDRKLYYRMSDGDTREFTGWSDAVTEDWKPVGSDAAGWYAIWLLESGQAEAALDWAGKAVKWRDKAMQAAITASKSNADAADVELGWKVKPWIDRIYIRAALHKATLPWRDPARRDPSGKGTKAQVDVEGLKCAEAHFEVLDKRLEQRQEKQKDYKHPEWHAHLHLVYQAIKAQNGTLGPANQALDEQVYEELAKLGF